MTKTKKKSKQPPRLLPDKLSDCLEVALADLDAAVKAGMRVNMDSWYFRDGDVCAVCLAGAVVAREFDLDPGEGAAPSSLFSRGFITVKDLRRLRALNHLREGVIRLAFYEVDRDKPAALPDEIVVASSHEAGPTWRADMRKLIQLLRAAGE